MSAKPGSGACLHAFAFGWLAAFTVVCFVDDRGIVGLLMAALALIQAALMCGRLAL